MLWAQRLRRLHAPSPSISVRDLDKNGVKFLMGVGGVGGLAICHSVTDGE